MLCPSTPGNTTTYQNKFAFLTVVIWY